MGMIKKKLKVKIDKENSDGKKRIIRMIASNESVDRDDDIIRADGWDLEEFKSNPIILYMHDHKMPPVAKAINAFVDNITKSLVIDLQFPKMEDLSSDVLNPHDHAKFCDMLYKMYLNGYMSASSVGFMGTEYRRRTDQQDIPENARGIEFIKQKLLELSLVTVPSNPAATMVRRSLGIGEDDYKKMIKYAEKGALRDTGVVSYDPGTIVETEWDSAAINRDSTPEQLAKLSLIWNNTKEVTNLTKADSKLPHHEVNGDVNRNAVIAMKAALVGARGGVSKFPEMSQDDFDGLLRSAIEEHANKHFEDVEIDTIELDSKCTREQYHKEFEEYYDKDQLDKAWDAESTEKAFAILTEKKLDIYGNMSAYDIERMIDSKLVDAYGDRYGFVMDLYPISYPSGHCTIVSFDDDKLMLHKYIIETDEAGETACYIGEGQEIEYTMQIKARAAEKAGARLSMATKEYITAAIDAMSNAETALKELMKEDESDKSITKESEQSQETNDEYDIILDI